MVGVIYIERWGTHTVGKDLGRHLAAERGQQHTASQQQTQLLLALPGWLASQLWQGTPEAPSPLHTSFSGPGLLEGRACLVPKAPHRILLPSPRAVSALAQSQAQCRMVWVPGVQGHQTKATGPQ